MTPSAQIAAFIQGFEKCSLVAFKPTPDDVWTCGFGATEGVTEDTVWTQDYADERFITDLAAFSNCVTRSLGIATSQSQFDAMTSFAYNEGCQAFTDSTLIDLHNQGNFAGAALQFGRWIYQDGVVLDGLVKRRAAEAAIYENGTYPA